MNWIVMIFIGVCVLFPLALIAVLCKLNGRISREEEKLHTHLYVGLDEERCVCCGEIIPEGRQVCQACMNGKE